MSRSDNSERGSADRPRWWRRALDCAAVLFVAYGVGVVVWIKAHPEVSSQLAHSIEIYLWFVNIPFFVFGVIWLTVRISRTSAGVPLQSLAQKHPFLGRIGFALIAIAVVAVAIRLARMF